MDFHDRALANFKASNEAMARDLQAMLAEHSAKGRLHSGMTAIRAVEIFEQHSCGAVGRTLDELAKHIEHRGRAWRRAIEQIEVALESQIASAPDVLQDPLRIAGATGDNSTAKAVAKRLAEVGVRLRSKVEEFGQGWTAPKSKDWKDRHPNLDRILFAVLGAALAAGADWLGKAL